MKDNFKQWKRYPKYKNSGVEWLGMIPESWEVKRLKFITRLSYGDSLFNELREEGDIFVYGSNGIVGTHNIANTLYPCIVVGRKGSYRKVTYSDTSVFAIDTTYFIDTKTAQIKFNFRWLFYSLLLLELDTNSQDTGVPGLSREFAYNQWLPIPPFPEQQQIAQFLDQETAKIDTLINKKQRLIELLQEKRTAIISHAVTKGLNPDVPMKDSGVEWLGMIPESWEVKSMKRLSLIKRGASPRPIDNPIYFDDNGEYVWVRISDVTSSNKYLLQAEQRLSELGKSKSVALEAGELFLSICATVGKPIITKIKCCIHDGFVYFPNLKESREYLFYIFLGGELYKGLGKMGTQLNLNTDIIGEIKLPNPPLSEQQKIAEYLDTETQKIDTLINKTQTSIEYLKEYRIALISAAVTGKIDVREKVT